MFIRTISGQKSGRDVTRNAEPMSNGIGAESIADRLFEKLERRRSDDGLSGANVLVIAPTPDRALEAAIVHEGADYFTTATIDDAVMVLNLQAAKWQFIFIVSNDIHNVSENIPDFMALRRLYPALPIVWLSPKLAHDAFGSEIPTFCDAAVSLPVSDTSLHLAAVAARKNRSRARSGDPRRTA
jgi:hypothetical protein